MSVEQPTQHPPARSRGFRILLLSVLLAIAWLLWSGLFKPLLIGLGALSCALTVYVLHRMGYFSNETFAFRYSYRLFGYWIWLGKEVLLSSLEVSRAVLSPRSRYMPMFRKSYPSIRSWVSSIVPRIKAACRSVQSIRSFVESFDRSVRFISRIS